MSVLERFKHELFELLKVTFEEVEEDYLDKGTSLFETLASVSAEMASRPVSENCGSIAAQVEHIRFFLDVLESDMLNKRHGEWDWQEIWRTVEQVTPEEWEASQTRLRETYQRVMGVLKSFETWEGENEIGGALAILVHTAYHLGEIRQALCTVGK